MEVVTYIELDASETTFRFTAPRETVEFDALPILQSCRVTPAVIDPGRSIGQRESVSLSFQDCHYRFDTDSFTAGTFWTKFRARYVSLQGAPLRVLRGVAGQALADMESRLYLVDAFQVSENGASITAKDPLTLLNGDAAQAPLVSNGELSAPLAADALSLTLSPVGIGDLQYPSSGKLCIGGNEIVSFTRSGDVCTLGTRGENTEPTEHEQGSKVQAVLWYDNETPSAIIYDLLTEYANVDPDWITLADWQSAVDEYVNRNYAAQITEPVSVKTLLDELCEQVGLVIWWDSLARQIRIRPLLPVVTGTAISPDRISEGTFRITEQPDKRVSQVWTFYGQRDPTRSLDDQSNYARAVVGLAPDVPSPQTQPAIRKIFARWIPFAARSTAERLNDLVIARFATPPRKFAFDLFRNADTVPKLGAGVTVNHWRLCDGDGVGITVPSQVISESADDDHTSFEAEEMVFTPPEEGGGAADKFVFIDGDLFNANLRELFDQIYTSADTGDQITFVVESGVKVGSLNTSLPAMAVGDWPESVDLFLTVNGRVQGAGGQGGDGVRIAGVIVSEDGDPGGPSLYTRRAITVTNSGGLFGGSGGGAGGSGPGGGGAGFVGGQGGGFFTIPGGHYPDAVGTPDAGGLGHADGSGGGGNGGGPGLAGGNSSTKNGGAAGDAVDGDSYITWAFEGDIRGAQVN